MGKRGPCPTPTPILKVRGSWRAKTRKNESEPETGRPRAPDNMPVPVAKVWHALLDNLEKMPGILATCDGGQLERYCVYFVRWHDIEIALGKLGDDVLSITHGKQSGPLFDRMLKQSLKIDAALKQVEREFHLTPSARARVGLMNAIWDAMKDDSKKGKARFFAG